MVIFNKGRFLFMFDPTTKKLSAIYDTKYEGFYQLSYAGFTDVFEIAVLSLDSDAVEALKIRLEDEPIYLQMISKIVSKKNNLTVE